MTNKKATAPTVANEYLDAQILPANTKEPLPTATNTFKASGKGNPCPICGRVKDGSCSISDELVLCHHGSSHHPPEGLKPGDTINGNDGQQWAYCGESKGRRTATFTLHKPLQPAAAPSEPPTRGAESVWRYSATFYVCRFPSKRIRPLTWVDGAWLWRAPKGNRPMLLSHPLAAKPDAMVLIVEGEKTRDAAQKLFPGLVACCWSGGCKAIEKTNFTPLAGRKVLLWPDNDDAGRNAMQQLAQVLYGVGAASVKVVANPDDAPQGWDIADADWSAKDAAAWVKDNASAVPERTVNSVTVTATAAAAGDYSRPIRLETHQVMELLPKRIGNLRLNVRSGEVIAEHTGGLITLSGNDIGRLYLNLSSQAEKWPKDTTADAVALLAGKSPFDPVEDNLNSNTAAPLPLEQWQRLDKHLLGIDDPIAAAFLPRYLISAVARVFEPGCYVRQTPVLIGKQERGKSELGRILFGANHWVEGIGELGKDDLMKAHTAWGVELAELDGVTRRADQERLKAFLTEKTDTYRKPYDRAPESHHRRFVFWGTSNGAPLRDTSGSTRFVCIPIPDRLLPLDWARQNRDAIWSRAVEQYRGGIDWIHTDEPMRVAIAERNTNFQEIDPWADEVAAYLEKQQLLNLLPVQVTKVLAQLQVPKERQNAATAKRVTAIAEQLGWVQERRRISGKDKIRGLWPVDAGHTGHTVGTPRGGQANTSEANGSRQLGTPDIPSSKDFEKVVGEQEAPAPSAPPATPTTAQTPDTFCAFGVPGVPTAENNCAGVDLSDAEVCPEVCPEPEWHQKARLLRMSQPELAYSTIALMLEPPVSGRQVREFLEKDEFQF